MKTMECVIFNVDHGFCAFIRSPNNYGLMIDIGGRSGFSPIKWIRQNYNYRIGNIQYFEGRRIAETIVTHMHLDHFSDVGSFRRPGDKPRQLLRDKKTIDLVEKKQAASDNPRTRHIMAAFRAFEKEYSRDIKTSVPWGFDSFAHTQLPHDKAESVSTNENELLNNRSFILSIGFGDHKILFPGDMQVTGWQAALQIERVKRIVANTTLFVAPHHGHKSSFSAEILGKTGVPLCYFVSAKSGDQDIDTSYSKPEYSSGVTLANQEGLVRMISTRQVGKSIRILIGQSGPPSIDFVEADDNLSLDQRRLAAKVRRRKIKKWFKKP